MYQGLILEVKRRTGTRIGIWGKFQSSLHTFLTEDDGLNNTSNAEVNGDFNSEFTRTYKTDATDLP